METHASEKKIKNEILMKHLVPLKADKIDKYMEELLSENKKNMSLQNEKTLMGIQEKVVNILSTISKLFHIMEEEGSAASNDLRLQKCATFFDQMVLLIRQVFNSLTYHRRKNVLSTLVDNKVRVKNHEKTSTAHG